MMLRRSGVDSTAPTLRWPAYDSIPAGPATAAVAAIAAAGSAASSAVVAAASGSRTRLARLGLVDGESAAVLLLAVERCDGALRLGVAAHLDEAEALAPAGVAILDDFGALHVAVRGAHRLQVRTGDVVTEISDV